MIGKNNTIPIGFDGPDDILTRPGNSAIFLPSIGNKKVKLIRKLGPASGRIQITLKPDVDAKEGDIFDLKVSLILSNGTILSDEKECEIIVHQQKDDDSRGGLIEASRPNFKIIPLRKRDWPTFDWNEFNIGIYELKKDQETKNDILQIYVNLDSKYLDEERKRRRGLAYSQNHLNNVENKYIAYLAYHLYLQYESEKTEYETTFNETQSSQKNDGNIFTTKEQKDLELERVAKTLILSFRTLKDLDSD